MNNEVYKTDDGHLMGFDDFFGYVVLLIMAKRSRNENWQIVLAEEYWGDQLLDKGILNTIKNYVDAKDSN